MIIAAGVTTVAIIGLVIITAKIVSVATLWSFEPEL